MRNTIRLHALVVIGLVLGGCPGREGPATAIEGECKIFTAPTHPILGKNRKSQRWIDGNIERGVAGCGWQRPRVVK